MPSMTTTPKLVIFTDLDGSLLDRSTYSFEPAQPALRLIKQKGIPLSYQAVRPWRRSSFTGKNWKMVTRLSLKTGCRFYPKDYFSFRFPYDRETDWFFVLELGIFYPRIIEVLDSIKKETGISMKGFSDLTRRNILPVRLGFEKGEMGQKEGI